TRIRAQIYHSEWNAVDARHSAGRLTDAEPVFALAFDLDLTFVFDFVAGLEAAPPSGDLSEMAIELMQKRNPVGGGPSSKTCPRWAPQRRHMTSRRGSSSL